MTYDLCNAQGEQFSFSLTAWEQILKLAEMYDWHPAGTLPPEGNDKEWDGNYVSNDGQVVSPEDARAIGEALARAMDDVPGHDAMNHKTGKIRRGGRTSTYIKRDAEFSPLEFFSGQGKKHLREFVRYCNSGGFEIW